MEETEAVASKVEREAGALQPEAKGQVVPEGTVTKVKGCREVAQGETDRGFAVMNGRHLQGPLSL